MGIQAIRRLQSAWAALQKRVGVGPKRVGEPIAPHVVMGKQATAQPVDLLTTGVWQYMPGCRVTSGGLILSPTGLCVVNKRKGGEVQPNPPINAFGLRLSVADGFAVRAHIEGDAPVALQLYGQLPIRFDDFIYERSRVESVFEAGSVTAKIWDGSRQEPTVVRSFAGVTPSTNYVAELRRTNSGLKYVVDGKVLGSIPAEYLFRDGVVWLGLHSEHRPIRIRALSVLPLEGGQLRIVDTSSLRVVQPLGVGLQPLVQKQGFTIGAAAALYPLVHDASYAQLFLGGNVGSITPENELKPQNIQPSEGKFEFGPADAMVALAARHGLAVHGHTLVYGKAMPRWMHQLPHKTTIDKRRVTTVLEHHVKTIARHYKGHIATWDVANEVIEGFGLQTRLEENIWFRALGEHYLDVAFHAAHQADPAAKLFLNDFGMETDLRGRGTFMYVLAQRLLSRGVPLHGIGIQGHVYELPRDAIKADALRELMHNFEQLGLEVRVSELDVTAAKGVRRQAQQYAEVLRVCLETPNCTGLTIWGLTDLYGSTGHVEDGRLVPGDALPFTADYRPKPAWWAMRDVLAGGK